MPVRTCLSAERYTRFLIALLDPRRGSGGWVTAEQLAFETECSRATAYRLVRRAELAGLPIERSVEPQGGVRQGSIGFRCMYQTTRRPTDSMRNARSR
jgi:predicted transcriptional regulator